MTIFSLFLVLHFHFISSRLLFHLNTSTLYCHLYDAYQATYSTSRNFVRRKKKCFFLGSFSSTFGRWWHGTRLNARACHPMQLSAGEKCGYFSQHHDVELLILIYSLYALNEVSLNNSSRSEPPTLVCNSSQKKMDVRFSWKFEGGNFEISFFFSSGFFSKKIE